MLTALGVPSWVDYVAYFNKIQSFILYSFSIYVSYVSSFWVAVGYAATFTIGRAIIMSIGLTYTQNTGSAAPFVGGVLASTIFMLVFNIAVITHYLQMWRL